MKLEKIKRNELCIIEWNGVTNHSISIGSVVQAQVSLKAIKKLEKIKQYLVELTLIMEWKNICLNPKEVSKLLQENPKEKNQFQCWREGSFTYILAGEICSWRMPTEKKRFWLKEKSGV